MSASALALVLAAALIHATWNLMAKRAAAAGATFVFSYSLIAAAVYAPWMAWLAWHGQLGIVWAGAAAVAVSAIIHLGYSVGLQRGYQVADLSVVYPVARGTGPMLSSIGAYVILQEAPTPVGLLGLGFVVVGIALIATQGTFAAFRTSRGHIGLRWGLTLGALIATYTVVDAYSVKVLGVAPLALDWTSNVLRCCMLAPMLARHRASAQQLMRGRWRLAAGVGLLSPLSYIFVLAVLAGGAPLSFVAPAREMSMMVGALLGLIVLREPVGVARLGGCALLVTGVVLLGIG